ncbi:endothelin-1 [Acipenser oxyrinchus oxyrinchus]|uniref:Endothelin-1 n=1 Tax=Acipenser oxyrinchus oxyrinchus TaxID=40147 RepID=A0AAD8GBU7_ACIOX|nr:endothelin-1 [Acipenser oxyrinchus oxyrinchus]
MDLSIVYFLTATLVLVFEKEVSSVSIGVASSHPYGTPLTGLTHKAPLREKRCSCESLKDKECVYFCHIGIVWVNTPGQVVPYGVENSPRRLKRDAARCLCDDNSDTACLNFCVMPSLVQEQNSKDKDSGQNKNKTFQSDNTRNKREEHYPKYRHVLEKLRYATFI